MANFYDHPIGWIWPFFSNNAGPTNFTLDAATDAVEWIFSADEAATITRIGIRQGAVTGTSPSYRVSLQGVGATTGNPDGTIKGATNSCYADVSPVAGGNGAFTWLTLGETYACSRAEKLAIVIAYTGAATIDGSNNCSFTVNASTNGGPVIFPYAIQNNGGVRTKQTNHPYYAYGSASKAYGRPLETMSLITLATTTTPDEAGMIFTLPATWGDTFQVRKVYFNSRSTATGATFQVKLYDTDGTTVLQQVAHDTDIVSGTGLFWFEITFDEATLSTLSFGSTYRLTIVPDAGAAITVYYNDVDAVADWDAWPLLGTDFYYTSRADGGAWTDTNTRKPVMALGISDWTVAASGGGSIFASPVIT